MPQYTYQDKKSGAEVDVIRTLSEMDLLPTREECSQFTDEQFENAEWERLIGGGITVNKGWSWGIGKGYWGLLLVLFL